MSYQNLFTFYFSQVQKPPLTNHLSTVDNYLY